MISRQCYSSGCWTVFVCRQSMLRHMLYQRTVYTSWSADSVHLFKLLDLLVLFSTLSNLNSSNYMIYLLEFEWFEMLVSLVGNVRSHLRWFAPSFNRLFAAIYDIFFQVNQHGQTDSLRSRTFSRRGFLVLTSSSSARSSLPTSSGWFTLQLSRIVRISSRLNLGTRTSSHPRGAWATAQKHVMRKWTMPMISSRTWTNFSTPWQTSRRQRMPPRRAPAAPRRGGRRLRRGGRRRVNREK